MQPRTTTRFFCQLQKCLSFDWLIQCLGTLNFKPLSNIPEFVQYEETPEQPHGQGNVSMRESNSSRHMARLQQGLPVIRTAELEQEELYGKNKNIRQFPYWLTLPTELKMIG